MRRTTFAISIIAALSLAACGGSDSAGDSESADPAADVADTGGESAETDAATDDSVPATDASAETTPPAPSTTENPDKPEVELPAEMPTELERTVLVEGTGDPAEAGDTVIVDYVGVRSSDGEEFDNSWDRGEPFILELGTGSVIQGWEDGLVGAQAGEQVQLDIPSDLAYGEAARGEVIGENENLTFVIDVRNVAKATDAPTEPGVELSTEEGVETTEFEDLVEGNGDPLEIGDTAVIRYVNFRGDNGVAIEPAWTPQPLPFDESLLPGLVTGMEGMNVGGVRAITIPPEEGFGVEGRPQSGLPADTDMIFVVELLAAY
ncbi:FKBP-type peptidyl-prolyl cis-trans isomerase [Ilumatobacter nonamiensis]|uniref:FKBP-type peptidyl-prolyl cis-trans isomerase n=1 Tax=Ilumatobacter nonamiensis TaxID=467093 RepID=UPI0003463DB2|nr:FKBP-type peptidyl-prolyl cis-trans isomerase [Ilumatobacter nonamiensis]